MIKVFRGYRPNPPKEYYEQGAANAPDEPQYEGVVFSDGTVAVRWLTKFRSHSIWSDWESFYEIHGHPEYGTRIDWIIQEDKNEAVERDLDAEIRHVQETTLTDAEVDKQIEAYNAFIDARRKLQTDAREKPWLPLQPGEEF